MSWTQNNNILEFNGNMKSDKAPCIIYTDLESLIMKLDNCKNYPEKSLVNNNNTFLADILCQIYEYLIV